MPKAKYFRSAPKFFGVKIGALPQTPVRGGTVQSAGPAKLVNPGEEDANDPPILKALGLWSGARPEAPLGPLPVCRLGALVPLGAMRILHHALSETDMPDRRLPCPTRAWTSEYQEETLIKVSKPAGLLNWEKFGNFVALQNMKTR